MGGGGASNGYHLVCSTNDPDVEPGRAEADDPGADTATEYLHQEGRQGWKTESRGQDS